MIKTIDQIYYWDDFLSPDEYENVWAEMEYFKWELAGHAVTAENANPGVPRKFWYKDLSGAGFTRSLFKIKTELFLNNKIITERIYANGQAHGQSSWVHKDITDDVKGEWGTIVYFLHRDWKPLYGGNLFLTDETETKVTNTFFPKTNSAVLFNSRIKHCGLEPSVYCRDQRISIAMKFKIKTDSDSEEILIEPPQEPK